MASERDGEEVEEAEEANDTEVDWGRDEQYTKEINTPRKNANVVTIYPSSMAVGQAEPVGWEG